MAKVTIIIEPEEENEGEFGYTTMLTQDGVVFLDQINTLFTNAARAGGWIVEELGEVGGRF